MPKLTEEQKEKTKGFAQKVGDTLWDSTAIAMMLILAMILICGTVFFFLLFYSAGEVNDEYLAATQAESIEYQHVEGEVCTNYEFGIDLADLGVAPLVYEGYLPGTEVDTPTYSFYEHTFSTVDDIESPTKAYTLHYSIWTDKKHDEGMLDEREKKYKKEYGGEPVAATLDYGATDAYWLGDELLLRYGDDYLVVFYDDTTRELLESQACADFMRTEMKL